MDRRIRSNLSRRGFLTSAAAFCFLGGQPVRGREVGGRLPWQPEAAIPPALVRLGPWMFFTADEAATVEAVVDRLIPSDDRGPGGRDAGCAVYIDRQLAGPYGRGEGLYFAPPFLRGAATQGYQLPGAPAVRYRAGLRAVADYIRTAFDGRSFHDLAPGDQDMVLRRLEAGSIALDDVNGAEFFLLLLANTQEGFFADPIYGGNREFASWKLIGFPGARYDYRDWVDRHNEPYPLPPVGIMGRADWTVRE
jgi:gluconate 2-dehydrogenase gamma chain